MVRQTSRNRGLYTSEMAKATETPSGFSTWDHTAPRENRHSRPGSNPTRLEANSESEGAAASKGLDGDLSSSA